MEADDLEDGNFVDGENKDDEETIEYGGDEKNLAVGASNYAGVSDEQRLNRCLKNDELDDKFGFERYKDPKPRTGFLVNVQPNDVLNNESKKLVSVVDYYFLDELKGRFKIAMPYNSYFYLKTKPGHEIEISTYLQKKFGSFLVGIETVMKEDLELLNHLSGLRQKYIKLSFLNVTDLIKTKRELWPIVRRNRESQKNVTEYSGMHQFNGLNGFHAEANETRVDPSEHIIDIRECDVPFHMRVAIDKEIFVGRWYTVMPLAGECLPPEIKLRPEMELRPDMIICAYDIETTKAPLRFPDSAMDQVMMISYMISGKGFLIVNREVVTEDIDSPFEYTPTPEFEGNFHVFNEKNEADSIRKFFQEMIRIKPVIFVTYNGDFFDWPFMEARARAHGMSMYEEIGFAKSGQDEFLSRSAAHLDCFKWVKRDSYLPVGSQNLKAVCKAKLRYNPVELDPEEMLKMAREQPQVLANYSVSDAVATYYLYMKYVHPFIFALCTIIPMEPDSVLRKGSGTLCEALLMVQAYKANVIFPNKQESAYHKFTKDGHVVESETYVGGHVEALESGIFRADLPIKFRLVKDGLQKLIENVERTVEHAIIEEKIDPAVVTNKEAICSSIREKLEDLKNRPVREEKPMIYHLDVAAMYPNIILTNRLQPSALIADDVCASCNFNAPHNKCRRKMQWTMRGEYMQATKSEVLRIQQQLETEKFPSLIPGGEPRAFHRLSREERAQYEKKRLTDFCRKTYKKIHITREEPKESVVCQRENSFYVDTVRMFRDRRYEYKTSHKNAKKDIAEAQRSGNSDLEKKAKAREVIYDSLQLAHKCILNSFYGYVMRRGARWYSMEMAGIVCHTGGAIIKRARQIVEQIGRPLELDTDGIWCAIPSTFPEVYDIEVDGKAKGTLNYPGAMLNVMVRDEFSNNQYQELEVDPGKPSGPRVIKYTRRTENSIAFEVDGPYLAMILPAAKEEGKKLKKRYAVFNFDGSIAELKGFEVKRRGELQLIKLFQSSVFDSFLLGDSLQNCYAEVAKVADRWLDILYTKGEALTDSELCEFLAESRSMSKKLSEYGSLKSTSISTAKRLSEFLGAGIVKDAGLSCKYIIAKKPDGAPVAERAIPLAIWQASESVRKLYLRKWLKVPALESDDLRDILDWDYYKERLNSTIQKIITIPAAMQSISNPVARVKDPDWLQKRVKEHNDPSKQRRITDHFKPITKPSTVANNHDVALMDIEAIEVPEIVQDRFKSPAVAPRKRKVAPGPSADSVAPQRWQDVLGTPPPKGPTADDLEKWLEFHRKKWAWMRETKKQRKKSRTDNFGSGIRTTGRSGLLGFVKQAQKQIVEEVWQVLHVAETGHPGLYKIWLLINNALHSIRLKASRVFYINRKIPKESEDGQVVRKVSKVLPRSKQTFHLYEYRVDEAAFLEHQNELLNDLMDPLVEGIYETQIPLMFRVLTTIGSICRIKPQKRREVALRDSDYLLDDVERMTDSNVDFFDERCLNYVYFYHHEKGNQAVYGLFYTKAKKPFAFVVVHDTVRTNNLPHLENLYQGMHKARLQKDPEAPLPPANFEFINKIEIDIEKVYRLLDKSLADYLAEKHGPTVVALHSKHDQQRWINHIPTLAQYPVVPTHLEDDPAAYAVVGWQGAASRIMLTRFLDFGDVLHSSLDKSRYFDLPWGNIPRDTTIYGCDLFYARLLQRHNVVMWGTPKDRPDFGGKETDDIRLIGDEEEKVLQIINPSLYSTCTVQIEVDYLAASAILLGQHVHGSDGTNVATNFERAPQARLEDQIRSGIHVVSVAAYDESAQVEYAFSILNIMVKSIFREALAKDSNNLYAEELAMHVFRWLRSPTSLLYDPALHRKLISIMRKMLVKLVADCKKLGCQIVYATSGWMVLSTNKGNANEAVAQVLYTMDRVREEQLFSALYFTPRRVWTTLLWLDAGNYGGIVVNMPERAEADSSRINDKSFGDYFGDVSFFSQEPGNEDRPDIRFVWNLASYLPESCQKIFKDIISGYLLHANTQYQAHHKKGIPQERDFGDDDREMTTSDEVQNLRHLIQNDLTQTMLAKVLMVNRTIPNGTKKVGGRTESVFPDIPGSHFEMRTPALELIKAVCKVLSLHSDVSEQVRKLKRDLLKLIGVGEFAPQSEWKDPCVTYIVPEVICPICNSCRDLDLCKDRTTVVEDRFVWMCQQCQTPYDTKEVEQRIFVALRKMNVSYHLQDLRCVKCKQIFDRHVAKTCSCGGQFLNTVPRESFLEKLRIFENVSRHFKMPTLLESVNWMLKMNNVATHTSSNQHQRT